MRRGFLARDVPLLRPQTPVERQSHVRIAFDPQSVPMLVVVASLAHSNQAPRLIRTTSGPVHDVVAFCAIQ
jgi:hypothetical protein